MRKIRNVSMIGKNKKILRFMKHFLNLWTLIYKSRFQESSLDLPLRSIFLKWHTDFIHVRSMGVL